MKRKSGGRKRKKRSGGKKRKSGSAIAPVSMLY